MHRFRCLALAVTGALGMLGGMELMYSPLSIAPSASCSLIETRSEAKSVPSGKQAQERRQTDPNPCSIGLGFALYGDDSLSNSLSHSYQALAVQLVATETRLEKNSFSLYGDTNRDGEVNQNDYPNHQTWSWQKGAFMLFNSDDDDGNGSPDWQDSKVNGDIDADDLAKIHLQLGERFANAEIFLEADEKSRPYINIFQKTQKGWQPADFDGEKSLEYSRDIVLGVEAKQFANRNWNGFLTLKAKAQKNGATLASDTVLLRVVPWIMLPNTAPVKELYVSLRGAANQQFVSQIKTGVEATGAKVNVVPGGTVWKQDTMEIGYVQFPAKSSVREINVVLNGNRGWVADTFARNLLDKDFGWFQVGKPRSLDPLNQWTDWYGNLEVTPSLPGYPLGRIYYGKSDTVSFHPDVAYFLKAQEIQGPAVEIDTSWLAIRHVDEIVSFIPSTSGKPLMMIVSPEEGVKLLKELDKKGYGNQLINRDLSSETTVKSALNSKNLISYNLKLQTEKINPTIAKVKREFKLTDSQIIRIPAMFNYGGSAFWPNMVNSVAVNGKLMVSNPRGALIGGKDYTQEAFRKRVAGSALKVSFLDDRYYQELRGNTHCATNTRRKGFAQPFWKALPSTQAKR
ncbi:MAG: protein-arginine deiminase domain-containing protein [Oscillatoria sp. Prado101]|nr:protein-arginine deiminase domain-containing protein [Oscillatoria sp. Prado101]